MSKPRSWVWLQRWIGAQGAWQRIFIFLFGLAIAWLPVGAPLYLLGDSSATEIVALALLYLGFLWGLPRWGRYIHHWPHPLQRYGLMWNAQIARDLGLALVIGALGVFALFGIETLVGWATPSSPSPRIVRFVIEGLLMALAVSFAEETLFRGWVLAELESTYGSMAALVMSAVFFAGTHFIKPWAEIVRTLPQFLGLVILGMALVWARRCPIGAAMRSRNPLAPKKSQAQDQSPATVLGEHSEQFRENRTSLGYSIGLHAGLIWGYYIVKVGGISEYTGRAPEWVTGIDSNPLAGILGLILLGAIASQFAKIAQPKTCWVETHRIESRNPPQA